MNRNLKCLLVVLSGAGSLGAQQTAAPLQAVNAASEVVIDSLEFPGGTLDLYVQILRDSVARSQSQQVNIVLDEDANRVVLPAFSLRGVTISSAFKVAQGIAKGDTKIDIQRIREPGDSQTIHVVRVFLPRPPKPAETGFGGGAGFPAAGALPGVGFAPPVAAPKRLEVISLAARIGQGSSEKETDRMMKTVLSALESALSLDEEKGAELPTLKFHAESGLLMVRGTEEQIQLVDKVVQQLSEENGRGGAVPLSESGASQNGGIAELKNIVSELREEIARLEAANLDLQNKLAETQSPKDEPRSKPKPQAK